MQAHHRGGAVRRAVFLALMFGLGLASIGQGCGDSAELATGESAPEVGRQPAPRTVTDTGFAERLGRAVALARGHAGELKRFTDGSHDPDDIRKGRSAVPEDNSPSGSPAPMA